MSTWKSIARQALNPALLLASLVTVGLLLQRAGLGDLIERAGDKGPLAFVALGGLACTIGIPRQVVAYAAGLAYGFWAGSALALAAELIGCTADFWWARLLARRWTARFLARGRMARLDRFLAANAFRATLTLRLLPIGSNVALNLLAGVSGVAAGPFLLASALGYIPQTVVFTLLGGGVRVSGATQMALAAVLMVASIALGITLMRRAAPA